MCRPPDCRYFLQGRCRFGANCRYLHAIPNQNQSKPITNSCGSGAVQFSQKNQQQKPNPFGFGAQSRNLTALAPVKPFNNKWTRPTSTASKQTDPPPKASVQIYTDPESCKPIIADDFKNKAPPCLPCDVNGDISCKEPRALSYEEAKQGRSLRSKAEREKNLLQSKVSEFGNLLCKPDVPPNGNINPTSQSNAAPTFTRFSQLGAASNVTVPFRSPTPSTAPNNLFGQPGCTSAPSSASTDLFGQLSYSPVPSCASNYLFGQPSFLQNNSQMQIQPEMKFGASAGNFAGQLTNQNQVAGSLQASAPNFSFGKESYAKANAKRTESQLFASLFSLLGASTGNNNASNKQQQELSSLSLGFICSSAPSEEYQDDSMDICKDDSVDVCMDSKDDSVDICMDDSMDICTDDIMDDIMEDSIWMIASG